MVPTAVFELVQVPPDTASVKVNVLPAQTEAGTPLIGPGAGLIVTATVVEVTVVAPVVQIT